MVILACLLSAAPSAAASGFSIGAHSMLYVTDPFGAEQAMFGQAAAVGASTIRLDIALANVFPTPTGPPDWSGIDQYMFLAREYHLGVLADLLATPPYLAACPTDTPPSSVLLCPPADPSAWARDAGRIAAYTRGVINAFEIINEPDGSWAFLGTPQQYAGVLSVSYDAIHTANPNAQVALGGLMDIGPGGQAWMNQMLATPGTDAIHKFDIANIHVRTPAADAGAVVSGWRQYFTSKRFHGPLWVTETGYPADPAWQTDPGYTDGPPAQARWLTNVIPAMLRAGAAMVFVTERDSLSGPYASEGVLQAADPLTADPQITRRPSFYAVRALAHHLATQARRVQIAPSRHRRARRSA
jgi:hypothetical protein